MTTINKDFRVKYGIRVGGDASVGGTVTVSEPLLGSHVATKSYVDRISLISVSSSAPEDPEPGKLWLDSVSERLHVYTGNMWVPMATVDDANVLQDHIHDTAIDGTGRIVSIFVDAGGPTSTFLYTYDAEFYSNTDWAETWSGGIAIDNFN